LGTCFGKHGDKLVSDDQALGQAEGSLLWLMDLSGQVKHPLPSNEMMNSIMGYHPNKGLFIGGSVGLSSPADNLRLIFCK